METLYAATGEPFSIALTVACTPSTWSMLRDVLRLSSVDAQDTMRRTVLALLPAGGG